MVDVDKQEGCPTCGGPYRSWWFQPDKVSTAGSRVPGFRPDMCKRCFFSYARLLKQHPSYVGKAGARGADCATIEGPRSDCPECRRADQYTVRLRGNLRRSCCGSTV